MDFPRRDPSAITGWHAHIYYDPDKTKDIAAGLRERVAERFPDARVGRWHDEAVGPHLVSMYQVAFGADQFDEITQWLALNSDGLNILIHPLTDNAYNDHKLFGLWLGDKQPFNEETLKRFAKRDERPAAAR